MIREQRLTATDPAVADHRVGGVPVLPAAAQIDAVLTACDAARPGLRWRVDNVTFRAPLRVAGPGVTLRTELVDDGTCTVSTQPADAPDAAWTEHGRASVAGETLDVPAYLDTGALRDGCSEAVPIADLDRWRAASDIAYGSAYRAVRSIHRGPDRMVAVLRADAQPGASVVPAAVLDGVLQCLGLLDDGRSGMCLPWFIGRIAVRRAVSGTVLALVERVGDAAPGSGVVRGRATVCTLQGETLLQLDRIVLKAAAAPVTAGSVTAPGWRPADGPVPDGAPDGATIVVSAEPTAGQLPPEAIDDGRLAAALAAVADGTRAHVVLLPGSASDADTATASVQAAFALVRCLGARPPMADLTIVTRGAQTVDGQGPVRPAHTALWGLARSLRVEHPRTSIRLVDLEPDSAAAVVIPAHPGTELVRRGGTWFVPAQAPAPPAGSAPWAAGGGRFLVTGGMGGIGLHVAEMLADGGCAHLTLVGRRAPAGDAATRIDRLRTRCDVRVLLTDVRDLADALRGADRYDAVVHAAGVLADGLARSLTPERIATVLAPKIGGVHAIDAAFPVDRGPGAVVLFSSISAVHGNLGQSSYSAANAYLDGYAAARRADGEAWFSLGWGLWSVGMGEEIVQGAAARGIPALSAGEGITLLRTALSLPPAHYVLSAAHRPKDEPMTAVASEGRLWPSLRSILQTTLHVPDVPADANLLELGLDSMMAVEIAAALSREGVEIDPSVFFEHAQVDALVTHLEAQPRSAPSTPATPAPRVPDLAELTPIAATPPAPTPLSTAVPTSLPPVPAPAGHTPAAHAPAAHASAAYAPPARVPAEPAPIAPAPTAPAVPAPAPAFTPAWNEFRDLDAPRPPSTPQPAVAPPVAPPTSATPPAVAPSGPPVARQASAPTWTPPPAPSSAPPATLPAVAPGTPRRSLPGRLHDRPDGRFLDRRIDVLSAEDRTVVAQDGYFYEPVIEEAQGSWIRFDGRWFLNFASYSYLGLIGHDYIDARAVRAVERHGTGAHGVRLLAGTLHLHRELELGLARFLGTEDAIVYSSGYMANVATVGALVGPGDVVIGDVYNHASILDGYRLSGAQVITYAHNDLADLERALRKVGDAGRLVVTDAVFSMDGDIAPLPGIVELCERYDAPLMVDEAHSLGVLGATGRGITEHFGIDPARVAVKMGTLSKTVPSAGGYVAGSADLVFALKNNARGWMFSAAATPAQIAAAAAAVEVIAAAPGMVTELSRRSTRYRGLLTDLGFDTLSSETPVLPVICRSAEQAQAMARLCQQDGLFVQPIVYPAVPKALPRLRTIVNLSHSDEDIDHAATTIARAGRRVGLIA